MARLSTGWPLNTWPEYPRNQEEEVPTQDTHYSTVRHDTRQITHKPWLWVHFCFRPLWEDEMFARLVHLYTVLDRPRGALGAALVWENGSMRTC